MRRTFRPRLLWAPALAGLASVLTGLVGLTSALFAWNGRAVAERDAFAEDDELLPPERLNGSATVLTRAAFEHTLLRTVLDNSTDVLFFKDLESRFVAVSKSFYTDIGLESADEMVGKTDWDLFPPEFAAKTFADEQQVMRTGQPLDDVEQEMTLRTGRTIWSQTSKVPLRDEDGAVAGLFCVSRDITKRKRAEVALNEQTARMGRIIETQRDIAAAELDLQGVMDLICERTQELTGADSASVLLVDGDELIHKAVTGFMDNQLGERVAIGTTFSGSVYRSGAAAICHDTHEIDNPLARQRGIRSLIAVPLHHGDVTIGLITVLSQRPNVFDEHDLTNLELLSVVLSAAVSQAAELEARQAQVQALARFRTVFEGASIGIARIDREGHALEANPALEEMVGYTATELAEMTFRQITHPEDIDGNLELFRDMMAGNRDSYQLEKRYFCKNGDLIWVQIKAVLQRDEEGRPQYSVSMMENITERKLAEQALAEQAELNEHQALHDALTGLPNRTLFRDRIRQALLTARRDGGSVAVLMMDLDRFKEVNDSLGHHAGDALLKELAIRLQSALRASDTVARLGGDEFGLLLPTHSNPPEVIQAIEKIRTAVEQPVVLQDLPLAIEASIGVSFFPGDGDDVDTLLQRADVAMYSAKEGNSAYAFYDEGSDTYDPARLTLVGELRRAIDERELVLYYQPKAALADGEVSSVEALLRWNHPRRGLVQPDDFIPLAQQTGLIKPLTLYVVDEALRQCRAWQEEGLSLSIAVNLSMRNLLDAEFPEQVEELLCKWQVDPALLELEITESTMLADPVRTKLVLERLATMGVRLSIDDFGTGYSSLAYLKRLPVNEIKIDRSFVMNMTSDEDDAVIVRSTIDLGLNLGLEVVAEGVETQEVWDELNSLGCTVAQGYYLSRPVPPDELRDWLTDRAT